MPLHTFEDKSTFVPGIERLSAVRQQAIMLASVDQNLQHHVASLGHSELSDAPLHSVFGIYPIPLVLHTSVFD